MSVERRFATTMREADRDDPGLIQEDDGTVWIVAAGGARTQLPGSGGAAVGCSYVLANNVVVLNQGRIPWDVRLYDTDEFIPDAGLYPSSTEELTIPSDGLYLLEAVVYSDNAPAGLRSDPLAADTELAGVIDEPSGSCDFALVCKALTYDPGTYANLLGGRAFVRPLREGDTVSVSLSSAPLNVFNGTAGTTISVNRIGDLPDVDWTQY